MVSAVENTPAPADEKLRLAKSLVSLLEQGNEVDQGHVLFRGHLSHNPAHGGQSAERADVFVDGSLKELAGFRIFALSEQ